MWGIVGYVRINDKWKNGAKVGFNTIDQCLTWFLLACKLHGCSGKSSGKG